MRYRLLTALAFAALFASNASAQTGACPTSTALVVNPTHACFTPSDDHNVSDLGVARVSGYELMYFAPGVDPATGTPTQTVAVGKPTPNAQNAIWLARSELAAFPVGQQYRAAAIARGPAGASPRSAPSNPFGNTSNTAPSAPGSLVVVRP